MYRWVNFCFPIFALYLPTLAQTSPAAVPAPVSSYQGKTYFLRSLCGDSKQDFDSDGNLHEPCKQPVAFTLDAVHINTIRLKGDKLTVEGEKTGAYLVPINHETGKTTHEVQTISLNQSVKLTIHASGSPPHTEDQFAKAMQGVFAATYAELAHNGRSIEDAYASAPHVGPPFAMEYEGPIYKPGKDGVTNPILIYSIEPKYSQEARDKRINGQTMLDLVVTPDGTPANVRVVRSLGYGLDEKAMQAVMKYRFKPAEKDGKPVAVQVRVEMNFSIK